MIDKIQELYFMNYSKKEVAKMLGISVEKVYNALKKSGVVTSGKLRRNSMRKTIEDYNKANGTNLKLEEVRL